MIRILRTASLRANRPSRAPQLLLAAILVGTPLTPFAAFPAAAQSANSAALAGVISSAGGTPLANARIVVSSADFSQTVRSGQDGTFRIALPPNTYSVRVQAPGFADYVSDGVTVVAGQTGNLRVTLSQATLQTIGRTTGTSKATSVNNSTASVYVVPQDTFSSQGQNQVVNVLDQIPGIEVQRFSSNAPGANTNISIRGAQPYESQILIDGHPFDSTTNGANGFNSTFINALLLGDVEVEKGPGSLPAIVENAVGGTLNFRTPGISSSLRTDFIAGYDSFDGNYFGLLASDTLGRFGFTVGAAGNTTPGYLAPAQQPLFGNAYGGQVAPSPFNGPSAAHIGVVNYAYNASQHFSSDSQLVKLAYNFTPQTSITLEQYSTQSLLDETGTNYNLTSAFVVPCISQTATTIAGAQTCPPGSTNNNYTSSPNLGLIGHPVKINTYAPYPNTEGYDNEPLYSAEFRTLAGPGSLLASYYAGAISRILIQSEDPTANTPCFTVACPIEMGNNSNGEPFNQLQDDIFHGGNVDYTLPFGPNSVTLGFDRHEDEGFQGPGNPVITIASNAYSLRGQFALSPKLTLESGNYLSNTSYVGTRFDPRDGLVYRLNPNTSVRVSAGSAFVAPYEGLVNPTAIVSQGNLTLPTVNFRPETSFGYDVGADIKPTRDALISLDGYFNNIFNRYASVTVPLPAGSTFGGTPITTLTQNGNESNAREEGIEVNFVYQPRLGLGFHSAVDLLRDYAYNQVNSPNITAQDLFGSGSPLNNTQFPQYPYSKMRNDLFYTFAGNAQVRLSATTYGANNAFGEPGFTTFDTEIRLPVRGAFTLNLGATNLFNRDDYQPGGVYEGGPTYTTLSGGLGTTDAFYVQPRTLFIQLQRAFGPGGGAALPRTSR